MDITYPLDKNYDYSHLLYLSEPKAFAARDQELVEELEKLLSKTGHRENVVSGITHQLQDELVILAQFLENVSRRRPKGRQDCRFSCLILL